MKAGVKALGLLIALALGACNHRPNENASSGRHPWTNPGVLRIAIFSDPKSLNPAIYPFGPTPLIAMFVYSWAIRYDDRARPVPDALSEVPTLRNGDVSRDGLTLRYKLRRNITWHDGRPLTCRDLSFTWKVVVNPRNNVPSTDGYKQIRSIDCSDPYVAIIHMRKLFAPYLQQLWSEGGGVPILPAHLLATGERNGTFNTAAYNALPVGSGPFKVIAWNRSQDVRVEAYPGFYLGKPKLREVVFKILSQGDSTIQIQTHDVDLFTGSALQWPRLAALEADETMGLKDVRIEPFVWTHVDFNVSRPIVSDRAVRAALAYATDRRVILDKLLHGLPLPADTDQHPLFSWAYTNDVIHYPYDPQRARALLDADGWKVGPDGIRAKGGRRLEFTLSACAEYKGEVAIQTLLQRQWHDVGVQADLRVYAHNLFFDLSRTGILQGGHYDVAVQSSRSGPDPDHSAYYSADNLAPSGQNTLRWQNATATAAMNAALQIVDEKGRRRDYVIAQQQLARDVPTIIIGFLRQPVLYNSDLRNFRPSPVSLFWDPWNYSI